MTQIFPTDFPTAQRYGAVQLVISNAAKAKWTAVAVDHWVATIDGHPVSIKYWPMGWILIRKASYNGRRGQVYNSLKSAAQSAVHNPKGY